MCKFRNQNASFKQTKQQLLISLIIISFRKQNTQLDTFYSDDWIQLKWMENSHINARERKRKLKTKIFPNINNSYVQQTRSFFQKEVKKNETKETKCINKCQSILRKKIESISIAEEQCKSIILEAFSHNFLSLPSLCNSFLILYLFFVKAKIYTNRETSTQSDKYHPKWKSLIFFFRS